MKTLIALLVFVALLGCPNWESVREVRCRQLDASTDFCSGGGTATGGGGGAVTGGGTATGGGVATGGGTATGGGGATGGGSATGGGAATGGGGADWLALVPSFAPSAPLLKTYGPGVRLPVRLWEVPGTTTLFAVEARDGGFSVWRNNDVSAIGNVGAPDTVRWCSSAVNEGSTLLANTMSLNGNIVVTVDDFDGGVHRANFDVPVGVCAPALAQYRRPDAGFAVVTASAAGADINFQRACRNCTMGNFAFTGTSPRVDEAVTDATQTMWFSALINADRMVTALEVAPEGLTATPHQLLDAGAVHVELSVAGTNVHAAWMDDAGVFWLANVVRDGGLPEVLYAPLPPSVRLVDLVENADSVVAVLEEGGRTLLFIRHPAGDSFVKVASPGFGFRPSSALLRTSLRIAGQCLFRDGGPGGDADAGCIDGVNPVLQFDRQPDGGAW